MSRSEIGDERANRFDDWIGNEFRRTGGFTALVILVGIGELSVTPLRSTWFHVVGDDLDWAGVARLLSGSGVEWHGVLFATVSDDTEGGPVEDATARMELDLLAQRVREDRLVLNDNHFFDRSGRRLAIEEVSSH